MVRLRYFLTALIGLSLASPTFADTHSEKFENIERLRDKITHFANDHFRKIYGEKKFERDVRVRLSQLDQRLKLKRCGDAIRFELIRPVHQSRNITIKTICDGNNRWSIFVPATLEVYADVVVAARNLERGTVIAEEDIKYMRIDTASLPSGHVLDKDRVLGMELRRSARNGSYLLLSALELPRVVNKGDSVVLESRNSSLSVAAKGTALDNGQVGEQIKVRNSQSDRVVNALVTGPGRVSVVSR